MHKPRPEYPRDKAYRSPSSVDCSVWPLCRDVQYEYSTGQANQAHAARCGHVRLLNHSTSEHSIYPHVLFQSWSRFATLSLNRDFFEEEWSLKTSGRLGTATFRQQHISSLNNQETLDLAEQYADGRSCWERPNAIAEAHEDYIITL